jgi:ArsR family transcriptional regulator, arsenate/arsenite/antimonite-responsive transcriptional repressor
LCGVTVSAAPDARRVARWFRALADETRLRVIYRLIDGEQCVCDLTDALGVAQSRLSFHLKTLREAGIVTDRREGRWVYYALNRDALAGLERWLGPLAPGPVVLRGRPRRCD